MSGLSWGRSFLMCPPTHFDVRYQINPWMLEGVLVDLERARDEWERVVRTLREAGAAVEVVEPAPDVPDMVFTANAGIVNAAASGGPRFVPSHFRHPEREAETELFAAWFAGRGWALDRLPPDLDHEGAGDALPFGGTLLSGHGFRSDAAAAPAVARCTGGPVAPVRLVDERLYHLDLTFCPLDERRALCAPLGWDAAGRTLVERLVPEPLWLTDDEALTFCANSVVVDRTVVMPATPPRVGRQLEAWGFEVVTCAIGEFLKAGGGCRCLTLALDTPLGPGPGTPAEDVGPGAGG